MSKVSFGESNGTETVREKCCDLEDYPRDTPEDHTENPIHQHLIEIMHERAKGDRPTLRSRDITLVIKRVNEGNKVLKCIPERNLSELQYVVRASSLLICEKVGVKINHTINKKEPFWKQRIEKDTGIFEKGFN